jgi:DNA-directed RNA polymerase subunit RPC12/RpoP
MTPHRSSLPDDKGQPGGPEADRSMSWGSRQSESETVSRAEASPGQDDGLVRCPSCGSVKTTVATSADRGAGSSIRRDNPGYRCFACGSGWTVTISGDHDPDDRDH